MRKLKYQGNIYNKARGHNNTSGWGQNPIVTDSQGLCGKKEAN